MEACRTGIPGPLCIAGLLCFFLLAGTAARPQLTDDDVSALLRDVIQRQGRMMGQFTEYTATYKSTVRRFDARGNRKSETVLEGETYQSSQRNVDVVLRKNGRSLSEKAIARERERAVKALVRDAEARQKSGGQPEQAVAEYGVRFNRFYINTFTILRKLAFSNPREDVIEGRRTIVLDFRPGPNFVPPRGEEAVIGTLHGSVWIDAADKVIARIVVRPLAGAAPDAILFEQQNTRLPDGVWPHGVWPHGVWPHGVWMDRYTRVNPAAIPSAFGGMNAEWIHERANHQRFSAKIEDVKIAAPAVRP
jgi:hypothetical protein